MSASTAFRASGPTARAVSCWPLLAPRCMTARTLFASAWLSAHDCDLVLLDVQMPGPDGTRLAAELQRRADAGGLADHGVPPAGQDAANKAAEDSVVIDDEHRSGHPHMLAAGAHAEGMASHRSFCGQRLWSALPI